MLSLNFAIVSKMNVSFLFISYLYAMLPEYLTLKFETPCTFFLLLFNNKRSLFFTARAERKKKGKRSGWKWLFLLQARNKLKLVKIARITERGFDHDRLSWTRLASGLKWSMNWTRCSTSRVFEICAQGRSTGREKSRRPRDIVCQQLARATFHLISFKIHRPETRTGVSWNCATTGKPKIDGKLKLKSRDFIRHSGSRSSRSPFVT